MGGTYRSARLPTCGPPAIGRYHQNRSSTVGFGRRWSIEGEINNRWSIEGEKGKKKKKRRRRKKKTSFTAPSSFTRRRCLRVAHAALLPASHPCAILAC
ncbi:hypothetical protein BHE74_00048258 [Ensete ventricosum]|nr:hypothetical protein GW17_00023790 [Ensete ventricosum]RWW45860.1 hypothetical protein BHE74_00048258 [Ensete ventricosum]